MRRFPASPEPPPPGIVRGDWHTIKSLLSYLPAREWRVTLVLSFLIAAKVTSLGVPMTMKRLIDAMNVSPSDPRALLVAPVGIIIGYGLPRLSTSSFSEPREILLVKVTKSSVHTLALQVFRHLHALSLRFHLECQTSGMSRDIERGTRGIQSLISYSLYSILPTLVEVGLVITYLFAKYDVWFVLIMFCALVSYVVFTVTVMNWRTHFRRKINELNSRANQKTIDPLLNFETVKYFGNESYEARRYDENLKHYRAVAIRSQNSLSVLNFGQQLIMATALILILYRTTQGVATGHMTLDDLVLVNTLILQIHIPFNSLGVIYRKLKRAVTDMDRMFNLLQTNREVADRPGAPPLMVHAGEARLAYADLSYETNRQILFDADFTIPADTTTAVVGQNGSGKSILACLLFRFYDVKSGAIQIDGQDLRDVTQSNMRAAIGIVPQDTVLFNDSIYYNTAYGRSDVSREEVVEVAHAAQIHHSVESLPDGYKTQVGECGLKLPGDEKQCVAITRTLLKCPPILVFDEAMSALDSHTEHATQEELIRLAQNHTTLVVAYRSSTIVHVHQILVMEYGRITGRGMYESLLRMEGRYAQMWCMRAREPECVAEGAEDARAG